MKRSWLAPLTPLYAAGLAIRNLRIENGWEGVQRLRHPVISIGNLSTGGSGKTPLTIELAKALTLQGFRVDVLSRGYGREGRLPARVRTDGAAREFGDEPILIAQETGVSVYVGARRYDAGMMAETAPSAPDDRIIHLLDDGFQHRQLHRDVDILLMNRQDWADCLLPAGNLREPLRAARRATVIAIPAGDQELGEELKVWGWDGPIWRLHRRMDIPPFNGTVVAFCGIARPQQFFQGLESGGLRLAAQLAFADHHCYSTADIERMIAAARKAGAAAFITTEKDLVRMGKLAVGFPESAPLKTAGLRIEIEDEGKAIEWLVSRLIQGS